MKLMTDKKFEKRQSDAALGGAIVALAGVALWSGIKHVVNKQVREDNEKLTLSNKYLAKRLEMAGIPLETIENEVDAAEADKGSKGSKGKVKKIEVGGA